MPCNYANGKESVVSAVCASVLAVFSHMPCANPRHLARIFTPMSSGVVALACLLATSGLIEKMMMAIRRGRCLSSVPVRSYLAGEWEVVGENKEHDGLRRVFLFFVDNRDVSTDTGGRRGGMKVLATSVLL